MALVATTAKVAVEPALIVSAFGWVKIFGPAPNASEPARKNTPKAEMIFINSILPESPKIAILKHASKAVHPGSFVMDA
jgi:hypothetical protein